MHLFTCQDEPADPWIGGFGSPAEANASQSQTVNLTAAPTKTICPTGNGAMWVTMHGSTGATASRQSSRAGGGNGLVAHAYRSPMWHGHSSNTAPHDHPDQQLTFAGGPIPRR